jgi:hypothetical protein
VFIDGAEQNLKYYVKFVWKNVQPKWNLIGNLVGHFFIPFRFCAFVGSPASIVHLVFCVGGLHAALYG